MNWKLLQNSLLVSTLATLLAVGIGFLAALWLSALESRWRNRLLLAAVVALVMPPFLVTNCWLYLLGYTGVLKRWLPLNIYSLGGTVWILALLTWPITLLFVLGAWQRLEPAQLEADPALAGEALIRWLLWPLAKAAVGQAAVTTSVLALNNFAIPALLQTKVYPAEVWVSFNTTFDSIAALKLSLPLIVAPLVLVLWFRNRQVAWPQTEGWLPPALFRRQLGASCLWLSGIVTVIVVLLAVGLPLIQLVSSAKTWTELAPALAASRADVLNSFVYAATTATVCLALALASWRWPLGWILWVPFLVPGVLLGIALILTLNRPMFSAIYQSAGVIILAFTVRYLAISWNGVAHAMRTVDRDMTEAAQLDGATRWQLLWHVQWPQISAQLAAAWYVIYLLCLWDVETLVLIVPPGGETLAVRIFNLLHYGHNSQVNALCLVLLALGLLPLFLWQLTRWMKTRWDTGTPGLLENSSGANRPPHQAKGRASNPLRAHGCNENLLLPTERRAHSDAPYPGQPAHSSDACRIWGIEIPLKYERRSNAHPSMVRFRIGVLFSCTLLAIVTVTGCVPASPKGAELSSKLFSEVQVIGSRGTGVGQFNKPRSVAVDAQDNLFVVDMTGRVQKFSPDGRFLLSWQMPQTDKGKPKGMCRDAEGNIIVIEPHYSRINHYTPEGKLVAQWGENGTNFGQMFFPRAVAVNSRSEIYVSEYGVTERVQRFAARGTNCLASLGWAGDAPGQFNRPEGLGIDVEDRLYVADSCNHRIQIFSRDGKFLRAYGHAGSGPGELSYPYDVRIDSAGRQYVCEFGNSRVQIFDAHDHLLEILGSPGSKPGQFSNPWSIALDSAGNLYVADSLNHRVEKFLRRKEVAASDSKLSVSRPGISMNRPVARVFQSAGSGDFPIDRSNGGLESPPNPGKTALQASASSWSRCAIIKPWRPSLSRKVGRAVLCAPTAATTLFCNAKDGAHGVTSPTSANRFMAQRRSFRERQQFSIETGNGGQA